MKELTAAPNTDELSEALGVPCTVLDHEPEEEVVWSASVYGELRDGNVMPSVRGLGRMKLVFDSKRAAWKGREYCLERGFTPRAVAPYKKTLQEVKANARRDGWPIIVILDENLSIVRTIPVGGA